MRTALIAFAWLVTSITAAAAQHPSDSIPFLPPEVLQADGSTLLPHRIELEETSVLDGDSTELDAFVYVSVESAQGWGERQLMIDWVALTWNGTGQDRNLVSERGLALRGRVTPRSIPFGFLVESHYYPGVSNRTFVDPDGELRRYPTIDDRPTGVHNEIVLPYVLSRMDLAAGRDFVLPVYSPYREEDPLYFKRFRVSARVSVEAPDGGVYRGWAVDSWSRGSLEEARDLERTPAGRFATYFVSAEAPYFLGKEWGVGLEDGSRSVDKRWRLTGFELVGVSAAARLEEILRARARRGADQDLPWQRTDSGPGR